MKTTTTIQVGDTVKHSTPSMLYHQTGLVISEAGVRHGRRYVAVKYTNPTTKKPWVTSFWERVLVKPL